MADQSVYTFVKALRGAILEEKAALERNITHLNVGKEQPHEYWCGMVLAYEYSLNTIDEILHKQRKGDEDDDT